MRSLSIAFYAAAILIIVLGVGRILGLPVFLSIVASGSMAPSLQPLDMVIAVRKGYGQGDIVIWCSAPMYCVIHRVVEVNGSMIITRGDANPAPDPPVSTELVRGVVVLVIPRLLWISLVSMPLVAYAAITLYRRRLGIVIIPGGVAAAYTILILYALFSALLALTSPINPVLFNGLVIPSVELVGIDFNSSSGSISIAYNLTDLEILGVSSCTITAGNHSVSCSPKILGSVVEIDAPKDLLRRMNLEGIDSLRIGLKIDLSKGASLQTYLYSLRISPKHLEINVSGGLAKIYNPNPFCVDSNITILWADSAGPWNTVSRQRCIDPMGFVELDLRGYRYAYIRIDYILRGETLTEQKEVMRDGKPVS